MLQAPARKIDNPDRSSPGPTQRPGTLTYRFPAQEKGWRPAGKAARSWALSLGCGGLTDRLAPIVSLACPGDRQRVASRCGSTGLPWCYLAGQPPRPACCAGLRSSVRYMPECLCNTTAGRGKHCPHQAPSGSGAGGCRTASTRQRRPAGREVSQAVGQWAAGRSSWSPCRG
jgi:hypothetical protein